MKAEGYEKINKSLLESKRAGEIITILTWFTTIVIAGVYVLTLILSLLVFSRRFLFLILVPAAGFCIATLIRLTLNKPRPYEVCDVTPLINKKTQGCSFPSRHVFSAFVISVSLFIYSPFLSIICLCLGVVLAIARVLSGVHFIKDVISGAVLGAAWALAWEAVWLLRA